MACWNVFVKKETLTGELHLTVTMMSVGYRPSKGAAKHASKVTFTHVANGKKSVKSQQWAQVGSSCCSAWTCSFFLPAFSMHRHSSVVLRQC